MKRHLVIFIYFILYSVVISGQGNFCVDSEPFCTSDQYVFPAGVDAGNAEPGPYYDCLGGQPNPAWYHMKIGVPGDIDIFIYSTPLRDIDFICRVQYARLQI